MPSKYDEFFKSMSDKEPSKELFFAIMQKIGRAHRIKILRARFLLFGTISLLAIVAFVPAMRLFYSDINESGFYEFVSLAFSDTEIVMAYWQDFAFLIAESFPVLGVSYVLASVFFFLFSIKNIVQDANFFFQAKSSLIKI